MNQDNTVQIKIPNTSEYVGVVRLAISGVAARMNFSIDEIENIKIAVSEATSNAVQYAYPKGQSGSIHISCEIKDDRLEINVKDDGIGFNQHEISQKRSANSDNEDPENLGLGLIFIKTLMDDASIESTPGKGTTIKMIKKVPISNPVLQA